MPICRLKTLVQMMELRMDQKNLMEKDLARRL